MAEKLKIISLGGLNEIGKNLTVYEYGNDIIVVDCGMGFPDDDMYGIDVVIPDVSYLIKNQSKIRGIFITHGHEDHIGAIPYVLRSVNAPIYATRMSAGLIQLKLEEHRLVSKTKMITCEAGDVIQAGKFSVEFIHVNHSIADAVAFAIKSPVGTVVHTGDFKIDTTPIQGGMIDLARFGALGRDGVLALLADSTNVERPGYTRSESSVGNSFDVLFKGCEERIIVTTFASNVDRLQQIINVAARYGRRVAVTGRSMENAMKVSTALGYMNIPDGVLMDLNHIKSLPKNKVCIITTGSQGETMSALSRMAFSTHRQVDIQPGDKVIVSASTIPGNENAMGNVINELYRKGADVVNERELPLHVSGHACQEELKIIHGLVKPKFFIPVHGEQRHLKLHAKLARQMGMDPRDILISGRRFEELKDRPVSLRELASYPWISLTSESISRTFLNTYFAQYGLSFSPDMELATTDLILPAVRHNLGIGFIPEAFAHSELAAGNIFQIQIEEQFPERNILLISDSEYPQSVASKAFQKFAQ